MRRRRQTHVDDLDPRLAAIFAGRRFDPEAEDAPVAIMRIGDAAAFVPARAPRLSEAQLVTFSDLQMRVQVAEAAHDAVTDAVHSCRSRGLSWDLIGFATGLTGRGAQKRWTSTSE